MQLSLSGAPHLTYCTNIHPGESLDDVRAVVEGPATRVKALVGAAADVPFGVGLRLSGAAARELSRPGAPEALRALLESRGMYCFTVNGFPYGTFHGERVKEQVYRPDWREAERGTYTERLARALAMLLPEGVEGSISTVPGAFRARAPRETWGDIALSLAQQVAFLLALSQTTGRRIVLCLEPEPECLLETTGDTVRFFREFAHGAAAEAEVSRLTGLGRSAAGDALRAHLGICLDACHLAVEYEAPGAAVRELTDAGIRIGKIQVTTALHLSLSGDSFSDGPKLQALSQFDDGVYLHQVVERGPTGLRRYGDLPEALAAARVAEPGAPREWRVHFHVPVFREEVPPFTTTQPFLVDLLRLVRQEAVSPHLEVETYTWGVLPPGARGVPVEEAIARELDWTLTTLGLGSKGSAAR